MLVKNLARKALKALGYRCVREEHFPSMPDSCRDLTGYPGFGSVRIVVDVGANIGQTADRYLHEFPEAKIISCEPAPASFSILSEKLASEPRAHCENVALGATVGSVTMRLVSATSEQNSILRDGDATSSDAADRVVVRMDTLDALLDKLSIHSVDLLKIDTEGFEMEVLAGGDGSIRAGRIRSILAECAFDQRDTQHTYFPYLFSSLTSKGFSLVGFYDVANYGGRLHYCNALFVRTDLAI